MHRRPRSGGAFVLYALAIRRGRKRAEHVFGDASVHSDPELLGPGPIDGVR